jgi:hypothetical protein
MKISKNNVSYFLAGYKAGLIDSGKETPESVKHKLETTVEFSNKAKEHLRRYNEEYWDDDRLEERVEEMYYYNLYTKCMTKKQRKEILL